MGYLSETCPNHEVFTSKKPTIQVAAAVIEERGRYLITQRGLHVDLPGYWEFPGGKREKGESLKDCVQREVQEELGVKIAAPVLLKALLHEYPDKWIEIHFFCCSIAEGNPRSLGCAKWCWVTAEELRAYQFPPADEPVIAELRQKIILK